MKNIYPKWLFNTIIIIFSVLLALFIIVMYVGAGYYWYGYKLLCPVVTEGLLLILPILTVILQRRNRKYGYLIIISMVYLGMLLLTISVSDWNSVQEMNRRIEATKESWHEWVDTHPNSSRNFPRGLFDDTKPLVFFDGYYITLLTIGLILYIMYTVILVKTIRAGSQTM